jgi:DNA-binding transcriptional LysR family regulator
MSGPPDPRYLGTFVTVCRTGSFGRAAAALGRTQPAISHQIRMLETELGGPLLERGSKRTVPTPLGRLLLEQATPFLAELAALRDGARRSRLRIASVSGFGRHMLFPCLLRRDLADLCEVLRYPTAPDVISGVVGGDYDVGFVHTPPVGRHLRAEPVARVEYVLAAPPRLAVPRDVAGLGELPWVTYDECDYVFGRWFDGVLGRPPPRWRTIHHFEELEETVAMVVAGAGVTIVPAPVVARERRARSLRFVRPGRPVRRAWNTVYAVLRAAATPSPAVGRLLDALRAERFEAW